ncbi:AraC family transcriptional regulator [Bacillus solitudinis]|uniref:AraC family transcriptional regulator n=1 Tax=Bacillus solitudinis TaxID=2014074 RepID=UPI001D0D6A05|nr:AraC family transcriptional regulator [Bacillus solitudinis]
MISPVNEKYSIENEAFSIQYLNFYGKFNMTKSHHHSYYEIFYLLGGERTYLINNIEYKAQKGDLVIINPHDPHYTTSTDVPNFERIVVYFEPEFILPQCEELADTLFPLAQGSQLIKFPLKDQLAIEQIIRELFSECSQQESGFEPCVKSTLSLLLIRIYRLLNQENRDLHDHTHPMFEKIQEITSYIKRHYYDDIKLEDIAKDFYISPSYLSRIFKKLTGFGFREYLVEIRMNEAKKQLRETQEKTLTIADNVGFSTLSHFNTTFKKLVGVTPIQYRKRSGER